MFLNCFLNIIPPPKKKTKTTKKKRTYLYVYILYVYIYILNICFYLFYLKPLLAKQPTNKLQTNPEV